MTSWRGTARSRWAVPLVVVYAAGGAVILAIDPSTAAPVFVMLVVLGVVGASFLRVDVEVGTDGLVVRSAPLRLLRVRFPLERIVSAEAIDVNPWRWGGWGYRGSVTLFRRAAWVLRRGEGIRVDLGHGRRFAVTVDDAATGAAVLDRLARGAAR